MHGELFPPVEGDRVRLRCPEFEDAEPIARLVTPAVSQWLLSWPDTVDVGDIRDRIKKARAAVIAGTALFFVIERKPDQTLVGWISVVRGDAHSRMGSVGYWLGEPYHGHGYMTDAARAALGAAFSHLDLDVIEAGANPRNTASFAVMRRLGMSPSGERNLWAASRGRHERCSFYEVNREAFEANRSTSPQRSL